MKRLGFVLALAFAILGGSLWALSTPSIPRDVLEMKYGSGPSRFVTLPDGTRVHYRDRGAPGAPALLLIHGSNASLFTWEPWTQRLVEDFRVVAVDLPGHGLTGATPTDDYSEAAMTDFVRAFADEIGLSRFAIAGNSMGGGIALRFAEDHPERVTSLILVDALGMPGREGDRIPLAFRLARIPVLNRLLVHVTPRALIVEGLNDAIANKAIITDDMIDRYWDFARMQGPREATVERFTTPRDTYVADHMDKLRAPTLILWGARDRLIPAAAAGKFHAAVPGSKFIVYPTAGHLPMEEAPDRSAADVKRFLKEPPRVAAAGG
jgi:pimeloyl-ACP methyl ester carboxylesterase